MRTLAMLLIATAAWTQTPPPRPLQTPWDGVPERYRNVLYGKLKIPQSMGEWKRQRPAIRKIVVSSLGDLPPRPAKLNVRTVNIDRKDGYRIEKFVFDNGVDSEVPGYIAIPEGREGRLPAILTMHGHSSSKDNMFGYQPTSQDVAEMLAKRGMSSSASTTTSTASARAAGLPVNWKSWQRGRIRRCRCSS